MITLKDEQGKTVGTASSMDEAADKAWRVRGKCYTNPTITFHEEGKRVGQYPPAPKAEPVQLPSVTEAEIDELLAVFTKWNADAW